MACILITIFTAASQKPLVVFDVESCLTEYTGHSVLQYDTLKLIASAQGLVNRDSPRLFLRYLRVEGVTGSVNLDDYWLAILQQDWLKDRPIVKANTLTELFTLFPEVATGAVLWDPAVPATANVAATVCGVEGLLPVRADGDLQKRVVDEGPGLPIKRSLVGLFTGSESGSAKCDAYLWAKREYLDTGKCHPSLMANYIDAYSQRPGQPDFHYDDLFNATLTNHDYYISQKAFFFDLGPWSDERPVDDPTQPLGTDRKTLIALLNALYEQNHGLAISTVGGFVPWNLKYTNVDPAGGKHEPVPTEWEYAAVLSAHNAVMDADALGLSCLTNASVYRHFPLQPSYTQNPRPASRPLENKTYVLVYMGDYDSAAWLARVIPSVWDDPIRGELPMAWAFNPNLADRVPQVFDHVYRTKSPNDWFIGGDSGAGYLNPNLLTGNRLGSGLPDAIELWKRHNIAYYKRFDYSITGFAINGFHGDMPLSVQQAYASFSPDGVGMQLGFERGLVDGTPFLRHSADVYPSASDPSAAATQIASFATEQKPQFLIFRMILQKPSMVKAVRNALIERYPQHDWNFCDPYTFFDLYRRSLQR